MVILKYGTSLGCPTLSVELPVIAKPRLYCYLSFQICQITFSLLGVRGERSGEQGSAPSPFPRWLPGRWQRRPSPGYRRGTPAWSRCRRSPPARRLAVATGRHTFTFEEERRGLFKCGRCSRCLVSRLNAAGLGARSGKNKGVN